MKVYGYQKVLIVLFFLLIYSVNMESKKKSNFEGAGNDLKILTWNIYMLPHCNLLNGNCKRARLIAEKLNESDYNIIVFEEAFDYRARRIIKEKLQSKFPYIYGPANYSFFSLKTSSGIWILSKMPLNKIKEIEYKSRFGIDALARKGAVMYEGNWKGNDFQLVGTHLQADSPDEVRREQCRQISVSLLQQYAKPNVTQFVCGDFNIEKNDTINYNYMLHILNAENGNMEGDLKVSYDELDNSLARKANGKKQLIDYVLVRNSSFVNFIKRRITVFRQYFGNKCIELSDHYAIEATVSFVSIVNYSASIH
jgi:endonuclease/exonuclease/phosphatase family metal-dependent hydrolase